MSRRVITITITRDVNSGEAANRLRAARLECLYLYSPSKESRESESARVRVISREEHRQIEGKWLL